MHICHSCRLPEDFTKWEPISWVSFQIHEKIYCSEINPRKYIYIAPKSCLGCSDRSGNVRNRFLWKFYREALAPQVGAYHGSIKSVTIFKVFGLDNFPGSLRCVLYFSCKLEVSLLTIKKTRSQSDLWLSSPNFLKSATFPEKGVITFFLS